MEKNLEKINIDTTLYETILTKKFKNRKSFEPRDPKKMTAFIPGSIINLYVKKGQRINEGDPLFILEAMKMQNSVFSHYSGKIKEVYISKGQRVAKNQLLLEFE
ncbi:MAG: acetyl-CoA carboxylase biotin carboxyl carrier protein subunit [bacterium]